MLEKILYNQTKVGLVGPWLIMGLALFAGSFYYSVPSLMLSFISLGVACLFAITTVFIMITSDKLKFLFWALLIAVYVFAEKFGAKGTGEILQMAGLTRIKGVRVN